MKNNTTVPTHIGFIMDGNRRWAKEHKMAMFFGHHKGAERVETIVEAAAKKGIKDVTFWAFSTENWGREEEEIDTLMKVFRDVLGGPIVQRMIKNGVKLQVIGEYQSFPEDIVQRVEKLKQASKDNTKITATIALNYGGRREILRAVNEILEEHQVRGPLTEGEFASHLFTTDMPDPDMIVRTGGEQRLSGFLAWQSIYSELYFTETLWPDFDEEAFEKALEEFGRRQRRFGK